MKPFGEDTPELVQNNLTEDQIMLSKHNTKDIRAQAMGGQRADQAGQIASNLCTK